MRIGTYQNLILFWVCAIGASVVGCELAKMTYRILQKRKSLRIFGEYFKSVGVNAMAYLCFNQLVIKAVNHVLNGDSVSGLKKLIIRLIVLLLTLIGLFIISWIVDHIKAVKIGIGFTWEKKISWIVMAAWVAILCGSVVVAIGINRNCRAELEETTAAVVAPVLSSEDLALAARAGQKTEMQEIDGILTKNMNYIFDVYVYEVMEYAYSDSSSYETTFALSSSQEGQIEACRESIETWKNGGNITLPNLIGGGYENAIRPWAHICFTTASCLYFNAYDAIASEYTKEQFLGMTIELISELAKYHCSNYIGGWGSAWQSTLWAENIGYSAWLLWGYMPEEDQLNVVNMVAYEANRFIDYEVPYYRDADDRIVYEGDTKGEENAWNSKILALATCMLPEDENAYEWESKMIELLISSTAMPSNLGSNETVDGYVLGELLNGSNINNDGTVVNHNRIHSDYMACIVEGMSDAAIIYSLAGKEIPEAVTFNVDAIYAALINLDLGKYDSMKAGHHFYERTIAGGTDSVINMPDENDWGGCWYASYYLVDTFAELNGLDDLEAEGLKACDWARQHLNAVKSQVSSENEKVAGQYFSDGENNFVSGEAYMMHNMCKTYILRALKE